MISIYSNENEAVESFITKAIMFRFLPQRNESKYIFCCSFPKQKVPLKLEIKQYAPEVDIEISDISFPRILSEVAIRTGRMKDTVYWAIRNTKLNSKL